MPYKVAGTMDTAIRTFKNPFPFRPLFPFYCPLDSNVINDIDYDLIPEETSTNYCEHTRETCVVEQIIDKTNIEIPTFLPTDSALWLDADDSSTLTLVSGAVSEWRDKSGNNRHATQATAGNRPLLIANELNGADVIRFDGVNDFFSLVSIPVFNIRTVFVVAKKRLTNSLLFPLTNNTNNNAYCIVLWNDGKVYATGNGYYTNTNGGGARNTAYLSSEIFDNATANIYLDGVSLNFTKVTVSTPTSFNEIGRRLGTNSYSDGDISQVIIFPRVLTQAEREQMEGYLAWSTGLQGNLPSGHPYKNSYNGVTVTEQTVCTDFYDFAQAP